MATNHVHIITLYPPTSLKLVYFVIDTTSCLITSSPVYITQ